MADFSDLYEQHVLKVYRFLLALTENELQAEELTQETFYKAFLHIDRFEGRSSIYTWLCQIGKNEWLQECRRKKTVSFETVGEIAAGNRVEDDFMHKNQITSVRRALLNLLILIRMFSS